MTYPQQPQYPQQFPQAPAPQYPPQFPQQPAPQQFQQYPQQPPVAPAPPASAPVSLADYYNQPKVSGGPSLKWEQKPEGTTYVGVVERELTDGDVQQQTAPGSGVPLTYRDGRPKVVLLVPLLVAQGPDYPDGRATWYCGGQARDELARAMAEAGVPDGRPPEKGAQVTVTLTGRKPPKTAGYSPMNQFAIRYARPAGAAEADAQQAAVAPAPAAPAQVTAAAPEVSESPAAPESPAQGDAQAQLAKILEQMGKGTGA